MKINQLNKEALATVILYVLYFFWWYYFAYIYTPKGNYFIFGLPKWFFYSCVVGLILVNILVYIMVKFVFKEIELDE